MANEIDRVVPPALPLATEQYEPPVHGPEQQRATPVLQSTHKHCQHTAQYRGGWQVSLCATGVVL